MKTKTFILSILALVSLNVFSQRFDLGQQLTPSSSEFKLIGISSSTGVATYHYIGAITDKFFDREIDDIIVGVKNGMIVTTIYNVIPKPGDVGVPKSLRDLIESNLPFPFSYVNGVYGVNIDNETISLSRSKNNLTFNKDRIMFLNSVKNSLLRQ
jgi:hypothetical protein